ncbi:hypothetical protein FRUB_02213 [Fimbriiglobus ruber]|uniref:Uncharacterized protein n=1 Tax=Fimbriiglobus ruber TaxID=1908690 RepID=A0A225DSK2_9BACT|nr:hypothetical protein FRUB_02213 [Fimbriiglobus ruber]
MQQKLLHAGIRNSSFEQARQNVAELMDLKVCTKRIERLTKRVGQERADQRDLDTRKYLELPLVDRKGKPADVTAPETAVVSVDGGRIQILDRSEKAAEKANTEDADGEEPLAPDEKHRGQHWREDKIAEFMTTDSESHDADPCPQIPALFVNPARIVKLVRELKTKKSARTEAPGPEIATETEAPEADLAVVQEAAETGTWKPPDVRTKELMATRRKWPQLGPMVAAAAWMLGFFAAKRKAFVADGAENNWTMWRNHFSSFEPILDIIHAISYVFAAATAGRPFAEGWPCYVRWVGWMWAGEIANVVAELAVRQAELGLPKDGDGETHPRQIVTTALGDLQNHCDKMKYDEYRKAGLPITSSYVESAVKQFNQRVKGTEKFWSEDGAEAILELRGEYLSDSKPLDGYWQRKQENETGTRKYDMAA